jgi:hypothetical protein
MRFYADIATLGAFVCTLVTFGIIRKGSKKTEQYTLLKVLKMDLSYLDSELIRDHNYGGENKYLLGYRASHFMNIYEWLHF